MDVENFEQYVLAGAERLISVHQPVIYLELWDNANRQVCFSLLRKWSYRIMVSNEGELVPYDEAKHRERINFLMIPEAASANR